LETSVSAQPNPEISFDFCTIENRTDTRPSFHSSSFAGLAEYLRSHVRAVALTRDEYLKLSKPEQASVKDGPAIILARFKRDGVRTDDEVEYTSGIGLDVDEAHVELGELKALLNGFAAIIYESANSTPNARRWRVLLPYTGGATPDLHALAFEHWARIIPGVGDASRNPSRLWYAVTQFRKQPTRIFEVLDGEPFDPSKLVAKKRSTKDALLAKIRPPADAPASEGARNAQLSRYAATVVKDCETLEQFAESLLDMSATYDPPLPDREVMQMARAKWKVREKFGWLPFERIIGSTPDPDTVDDGPPGIDAAHLFDHDAGEVPWLVPDMMTYGAHLLVGRPKGGKSWITMDMAYACGSGGTFLGKQARKTGVLWIASEDSNDTLARRLKVRGERPSGLIRVLTSEGLREERAKYTPAQSADPFAVAAIKEAPTFPEWLHSLLQANPDIGLVILDTIESVHAKWNDEQIDQKRHASVTQVAYQKSRVFEDIGQATQTCIVLVTHTRKRNGKEITDYHELINEAQTIVAGATASLVLADPADRDPHAKDDFRRVFAMRGRSIINDQPLMIELSKGHAIAHGTYYEVKQTEAQQAVFEAIEAILAEQDTTTIAEVAKELGMSQRNVAGLLGRCKRDGNLNWKGRTLSIKSGRNGGLRWV
jgi:hypothetical protein